MRRYKKTNVASGKYLPDAPPTTRAIEAIERKLAAIALDLTALEHRIATEQRRIALERAKQRRLAVWRRVILEMAIKRATTRTAPFSAN